MKGYFKIFFSVCILCNITTAWAVGANDTCSETIKCDEGLYCDLGTDRTNKCVKCPDAYPNADAGATSATQCYQTCDAEQNVDLKTRKPKAEKVFYSPTDASVCEYTFECVDNAELNTDGTACQCMTDYVANNDNTQCVGGCYIITLDNNLTSNSAQKQMSVKYGYGFYVDNKCLLLLNPNFVYMIIPESKWWQKFNGYYTEKTGGDQRFQPNGQPAKETNNKTFEADTTLYAQWSANTYSVEYYDDTTLLYTQTCTVAEYDTDSPKVKSGGCPVYEYDKTNSTGQVIGGWALTPGSIIMDYAAQSRIDVRPDSRTVKLYAVWTQCPKGYYCTTFGKRPCPAGTTSEQGSSDLTDCYISGATQFKDNSGHVFTLPIGRINYQ